MKRTIVRKFCGFPASPSKCKESTFTYSTTVFFQIFLNVHISYYTAYESDKALLNKPRKSGHVFGLNEIIKAMKILEENSVTARI
jgi:hypothetical protein